MLKPLTKKALDTAVDRLKSDGYMVLVVMLDQKSDETRRLGAAMEVLCSETNDPKVLAAMLKSTLMCLSDPQPPERTN